MLNVATHAIGDGLNEAFDFFRRPLGDEFYTAVGEVANEAGDVEINGDIAGGVTEANALNAAGEEAMTT